MTISTYEGIVEKGKIRLKVGVKLPENAKVYVVVPDLQVGKTARVITPHLANPAQANEFKMDAGSTEKPMTGADLLKSGLIGMWAKRQNIGDSLEFARELRKKAEKRGE
jgi:hypothetical protein